jgi:uncharacterized coiled-coil DUF342 family protein
MHTKPKRSEQIYLETIQQAVFIKKPRESIADVILRVFKIYAERSEESEYHEQWQEECSKVKHLEEENSKKGNRIVGLEEEIKKLKEAMNKYISTQITTKEPTLEHSSL